MSIEVKNMKTLHLAVVCPISGLPQNTEQARQAVWAEVTGLLQPNLGKFYSSFYPASSAWGVELNVPYGVLLGRDDPVRFVRIVANATDAQNAAIDFHANALLAGVDPEQVREAGGALICPVHLDGTNRELESHSIWYLGLATGVFLPDCGIYYMAQQSAIARPELRTAIAANLAGYAVCVVRMEVPV